MSTESMLLDLVREMRRKQKEYFKTRLRSVLTECRELERNVDAILEEMQPTTQAAGDPDRGPSLFDHVDKEDFQ